MPMVQSILWRVAGLAGLWVVFFPQPGVAWAIGAPIVAVAIWRSLALLPPRAPWPSLHWVVLPPLFFWESAASALQVAHRALWPWSRIDPGDVVYQPYTGSDRAIMAMSWVISALPGTLVGDMSGKGVSVHVLDRRQPYREEIARTERRIAWALREPIPEGPCRPS